MNRILYEKRCRCKEEVSITNEDVSSTKLRKSVKRSEAKPYPQPESTQIKSKTFYIKYHDKLSFTGKSILNTFQNKYIYYAIDDILYTFKASPIERDHLLALLYSPILSLQNNLSINFFDIWIRQVYIEEISKTNKFLTTDSQALADFTYITIEFFYKTPVPLKKKESLW
jgi:hypothetical protein